MSRKPTIFDQRRASKLLNFEKSVTYKTHNQINKNKESIIEINNQIDSSQLSIQEKDLKINKQISDCFNSSLYSKRFSNSEIETWFLGLDILVKLSEYKKIKLWKENFVEHKSDSKSKLLTRSFTNKQFI